MLSTQQCLPCLANTFGQLFGLNISNVLGVLCRRYKKQLGVQELTSGGSERDLLTARWCQPSLR